MDINIYEVMTGIYYNRYSVVRLIGENGYSHVKSFRRKKDATEFAKTITDVNKEMVRLEVINKLSQYEKANP